MADLDPLVVAIRGERLRRGLSLGELAEWAGLSARTIGSWGAGRHSPTLRELRMVADALGVGLRTWVLTPCGTPGAYNRHRDRGQLCAVCIEAQHKRDRDRKRAVRKVAA